MEIKGAENQPRVPAFSKEQFLNALENKGVNAGNANQWMHLSHKTFKDRDNMTPLMIAVSKGDPVAVEILLKLGAQVNDVDDKNQTALDYLSDEVGKETNLKIISLLNKKGAQFGSHATGSYDIDFDKF